MFRKGSKLPLPYRKWFKFALLPPIGPLLPLMLIFGLKLPFIPPNGPQLSFTVKNVPPFNGIMRWICGALIIGGGSGNG